MGSKSSPSPPPAPDPVATAAAQGAANREAAISQASINMVNQYTPYGSLEYSQRGKAPDGTPQYSATQTLSPEQQQLLDLTNQASRTYGETANRQLDAVSGTLAQPLDFGSLGPAPVANEETRRAVSESLLARMSPQMDRDRAALETRLANQGIGIGSEAYNAAIDEMNRSATDARLAADAAAGGEMQRLFGLESTARDRAINEMSMQRSQPLNELAAMLSGSQVQNPQFVGVPQQSVGPADIMGATYGTYNAEMNAYNQQMQNSAANRQGLYGLLGSGAQAAAFAWSDRRLKRDIRRVGRMGNGLGLYTYRYAAGGPEQIGLMADEVRGVRPHAVITVAGFDAVDYAEAVR